MKHAPQKFTSAVRRKIKEEAVEEAEKMGEKAGDEDVQKVEKNLDKMKRGPIAKI